MGKRVQSFSGLFNGFTNLAFRVFSDEDLKASMTSAVSTYGTTPTAANKQAVGEAFGLLFKRIFEMEVPNYQYKDYAQQSWKHIAYL